MAKPTNDQITIQDLLGQTLIAVQEPWDDDLERDEMRLVFAGGTLHITAIDYQGGGSLRYEAAERAAPAKSASSLLKWIRAGSNTVQFSTM